MNKSIGVFDSGVGGLTVLNNLINQFPNEAFLYVGDTKYCPYGTKTKKEIENRVEAIVSFFEKEDVKAIVIACNTATANSYHIKSKIPIIRIIEPTAKKALEISHKYNNYNNHHIGVLATNYTIDSLAYNKFLKDEMIGVRCSPFVEIVEKGKNGTEESYNVVKEILNPIVGKVDTIILGCTHFGLLLPEIKNVLPNVTIIDSSDCVSEVLKEYLDNNIIIKNNNINNINDINNINNIVTEEKMIPIYQKIIKRVINYNK